MIPQTLFGSVWRWQRHGICPRLIPCAEDKDVGLLQRGTHSFTSQRKRKSKGNCLLNVK